MHPKDSIMAEDQNRTLKDQFMLRLPDGMRDRIKAAAEANRRSMNAEIVDRLESTFAAPIDLGEVNLDHDERLKMDMIMREFANLLIGRKERDTSRTED
jgi:hypothetical protein